MPKFATPLPQSPRSDILEWRLPAPNDHLVLTGRSRAAWHTSFVVPQLNLLLDAGLCVNKQRPKHIFLTHGHNDHTLLTPAFVKREDPPDIYCPREMKHVLDAFVLANSMLNLGGLIDDGSAAADGVLDTHVTHALAPGDVVALRRVKGVTATAFACDHSVPCLGFVFAQTTHKLREELRGLPGHELKQMREAGEEVTRPLCVPIFAFLGDTTAKTLADAPQWLRDGIPVVITECSFLRDEHAAQAEKTKHTSWRDLEPVVQRWPRTTFVLIHFSMRYTDVDVARFFQELPDTPSNIVIWADPGADPE